MKSNRRNFIRTMGAGATGFALGTSAITTSGSSSGSEKEADDGQILFIGDNIALADTGVLSVRLLFPR